MVRSAPIRTVLVTGASGNLGRKFIARLLESEWCERLVGIDQTGAATPADERLEFITADLLDAGDRRWRSALERSDAVVHFAATNPAPDASWGDACASFDLTARLVQAATAAGVKRLVFASSNHVMGQYKDPPLADRLEPGALTTSLEPGPGTRWFNGSHMVQGTAYAASKLMGERLCVSAAEVSGGTFTTVSVRIGWCQPGDNRPETITANGISGEVPAAGYADSERDLRWFRNMWLSNRDFAAVMESALLAEAGGWPSPGIVVNGMSANSGMAWNIAETRRLIGYVAQDNIRDHLERSGGPA